ncbi:MAG: hypothetical protein BRD49_00110 [Bacteroidetes bacterium SW_10_40_5]|nr:MAG: hypothetical protein BRD49_00110 [Bacteroidetes bacterium SW_10_40_5]
MANILIATLGSRDIKLDSSQLDQEKLENDGITVKPLKNRPDILGLESPREDGGKLIEHFSQVKDALRFPILHSAINYVKQNSQNGLDEVILITTNQQKEHVPEPYWHNDTTAIGDLVKLWINQTSVAKKGCKVKKLEVTEGVAEYDTMYEGMGERLPKILAKLDVNQDQLFLLPQGGIDAINVATLLRCIELFPNTVQLAKPEDQQTAFRLDFPRLFHQNITKHKAEVALSHFDYNALVNLEYSAPVTLLAELGYGLLSLNHQLIDDRCQNLLEQDRNNRAEIKNLIGDIQLKNLAFLQELTFLNACIQYQKQAYSEFLLKIFTLSENLLKPKVEEMLNGSFAYDPPKHKQWNNLLAQDSQLKNWLDQQEVNGFRLAHSYPGKFAYKAILQYYQVLDDELKRFNDWTLDLAELRNRVAHELKGVTKEEIDRKIPGEQTTIEDYNKLGKAYFNIQDYGIFTKINHMIANRLAIQS